MDRSRRELGRLSNLRVLVLAGNRLHGPIPSEFGSLAKLVNLRLDRNDLSGSVPPELGRLSNLQTLELAYNQFTDCIPAGLQRCRGRRPRQAWSAILWGQLRLGGWANAPNGAPWEALA